MVLKLRVVRSSETLTLPTDWNPTNNRIWAWGAGGNGRTVITSNISAGGGGGGGGFDEATNVGGTAGDEWTLNVGVGGGGKIDANATFVQIPDLSYHVFAESGASPTGTTGNGGIGGTSDSGASSNSGGSGKNTGGGGGGGAAAGPHGPSAGTRGGDGSIGFSGSPGGGGGGGGGAVGDFLDADESLAATGDSVPSNVSEGANGGVGYYGTGAGSGGVSSAGLEDGTGGQSNTGGGGGGGARDADTSGGSGGGGASWDYILALAPGTWIEAPFTFTTTASTKWAELSNGTVPGGGGGGGGGRGGAGGGCHGGAGGFPGGGGGGGGFNVTFGSNGGAGADGLLLIFYEGSAFDEGGSGDDGECAEDFADTLSEAIEWPTCDLIPAAINIEIVSPTVSPGRSFTGREQIVQPDAGSFRITYQNIRIRTRAHALQWRDIESQLNGRTGAILVPLYEAKLSADPIDATSADLYQIGATIIRIAQTAGADIRPGMHFQAGEWAYRIKRVIDEESAEITVAIWPPLRDEIGSDEQLNFNTPRLRCRLERDDGMNLNLELLRFGNPSVSFVEDV